MLSRFLFCLLVVAVALVRAQQWAVTSYTDNACSQFPTNDAYDCTNPHGLNNGECTLCASSELYIMATGVGSNQVRVLSGCEKGCQTCTTTQTYTLNTCVQPAPGSNYVMVFQYSATPGPGAAGSPSSSSTAVSLNSLFSATIIAIMKIMWK
jgi:hypothetical protein